MYITLIYEQRKTHIKGNINFEFEHEHQNIFVHSFK